MASRVKITHSRGSIAFIAFEVLRMLFVDFVLLLKKTKRECD